MENDAARIRITVTASVIATMRLRPVEGFSVKLQRGHLAVVTGASGGLGEHSARQLAGRGLDLMVVARSVDKLEASAPDLRAAHDAGVEVMPADLNEYGDVKSMVEAFFVTAPARSTCWSTTPAWATWAMLPTRPTSGWSSGARVAGSTARAVAQERAA